MQLVDPENLPGARTGRVSGHFLRKPVSCAGGCRGAAKLAAAARASECSACDGALCAQCFWGAGTRTSVRAARAPGRTPPTTTPRRRTWRARTLSYCRTSLSAATLAACSAWEQRHAERRWRGPGGGCGRCMRTRRGISRRCRRTGGARWGRGTPTTPEEGRGPRGEERRRRRRRGRGTTGARGADDARQPGGEVRRRAAEETTTRRRNESCRRLTGSAGLGGLGFGCVRRSGAEEPRQDTTNHASGTTGATESITHCAFAAFLTQSLCCSLRSASDSHDKDIILSSQ